VLKYKGYETASNDIPHILPPAHEGSNNSMTWFTHPLNALQQDDAARNALISAGVAPFGSAQLTPTSTEHVVVLDTPDHHLAQAGMACTFADGVCRLTSTNTPVEIAQLTSKTCPSGMIGSWPAGQLRERLAPVIGIRALLPLTEASWQQQSWEVRNTNEKRIAHLTVAFSAASVAIALVPLRGFTEAAESATAQLAALGWTSTAQHPFLAAAMDAIPAPASPASIVDGTLGGLVTLRSVADGTLTIAAQQIDGIIADYDSEFLHDYRVCIRRVRSLLTTIKSVLAPEALAELKQSLGDIARATNELRDLDVYLLDQHELLSRLPTSLSAGGVGLFELLRRDRQRAQKATAEYLSSEDFQATFQGIQQKLHSLGGDDLGPDATTPIASIARQAIAKAYKKVIQCGRSITETTPEDDVHDLRILCKKLRYTIDFFGTMLNATSAKTMKSKLKKLQDLLGTFNDRCVQEEKLLTLLEERLTNSAKSRGVAAAIGALVSSLHAERVATRPGIIAAFADFADKKVSKHVAVLTTAPQETGGAA
jgi:CHAD domain-containing protein